MTIKTQERLSSVLLKYFLSVFHHYFSQVPLDLFQKTDICGTEGHRLVGVVVMGLPVSHSPGPMYSSPASGAQDPCASGTATVTGMSGPGGSRDEEGTWVLKWSG